MVDSKRFKDCVSLLISIIQNYDNHVRLKMAGRPYEIFRQFFALKSLMENEGCIFVTETTPLFGDFVFTELKFDLSYLKFCDVLEDLGFCVVGDYLVYRFKVSVPDNDKFSVGIVGGGKRFDIEAAVADGLDLGSRVPPVFNRGIIIVATEEDISC